MDQIDNNFICELRAKYGTPFYLMHPARFRRNLNAFLSAFRSGYEKLILAYSFKTNYVPALCAIAKKEGCYAEVVSKMELELALKMGFKNIIFNGPIKKLDDIYKAIENNAIINLDAEYELDYICAYKKMHPGKQLRIGLRVNVSIEDNEGKSTIQSGLKHGRFGFAHEILSRNIEKLRLAGVAICSIHGHTSSSDRAVQNYRIITEYMLKVVKEFQLNDILFFDIGGGFFGAAPDGMDITEKPTYGDYAKNILNIIQNDTWFLKVRPYIVIEPGASVVSNVFDYYTSVFQLKQIGTKQFVVVDGTIFDVKPTMHSSNLPFTVQQTSDEVNNRQRLDSFDVVGSTCMEKDIILHEVNLPFIKQGDLIQIRGVGAYTISLSPIFINYLPPIISLNNREVTLVRRRQTIEDVLKIYEL